MTPLTWRASIRVIGLNVAVAGAVLVSVGSVQAASNGPIASTVAKSGAALASDYALADAHVVAADGASWDFAVPTVTIVEIPVPVVHRAVKNSPVPSSLAGSAILEEAAKYVGVPYVYGGSTPSGFDCSGFVRYVYAAFGITLPRSSSAYWGIGTRVSASDARPGDLIVSAGHVAIYAGGTTEIDAPRKGKTIQFRTIWQSSYVFIRVS